MSSPPWPALKVGGQRANALWVRINDLRRWSSVTRSHVIRRLRNTTVGEHSYHLQMILVAMYESEGMTAPANVLIATAYHDLSEYDTGDLPATAKWKNPDLREAAHAASSRFEEAHGLRMQVTKEEAELISWADAVEFALSMVEELNLGNRYAWEYLRNAIEGIQRRGPPRLLENAAVALASSLYDTFREINDRLEVLYP